MAAQINHYGAVTARVTGEGNLDMQLDSLSDVDTKTLRAFGMSATTAIEPTRLTNFNTQRASITLSVDEIDEYFVISKVILWVKPIYTQYPSALNANPS